MSRRLPEPTLHIEPSWQPAMKMRWRRRYGRQWVYAAWWASGVGWYTGPLERARAWAWANISPYNEWHGA